MSPVRGTFLESVPEEQLREYIHLLDQICQENMSHRDSDLRLEKCAPTKTTSKTEGGSSLAEAGPSKDRSEAGPSKETSAEKSNIDKADVLAEGNVLPDEKCGICTDPLDNAAILQPCRHYACFVCAETWFSPEQNHTCPFCRTPVTLFHYDHLEGGEHKVYDIAKEREKAIENNRNNNSMLVRRDIYHKNMIVEWIGDPLYGGFGTITHEHITRSMDDRTVLSLWLRRELGQVMDNIGQNFKLRPLSKIAQARWVEAHIMMMLQSRENEEAFVRSLEKYLGRHTRLFLDNLGSFLFGSYETLAEWDQEWVYERHPRLGKAPQQAPGARPVLRRMPRLDAVVPKKDPQHVDIWWIPYGYQYAQGPQSAKSIELALRYKSSSQTPVE